MTKKELAQYLDSTILANNATYDDIEKLCVDAIKYNFKSICVNPYFVRYAKQLLENTSVLVCTVIGFPLGMNTLETKIYETQNAIDDGADEIDMVINISELKNLNSEYCLNEINYIKQACGGLTLKVIVETSQLNNEQKIFAVDLVKKSNADFIKTSTGFIGNGAQIDDIKKWSSILNGHKKIKASGGIRNLESCLQFIKAGANRIGTSKALEIIDEMIE